jgi:hypothetical protein
MKITVVPAQITTVEDTIAGSLTLNQALLLIAPILLSGLLFVLLPPFLHGALYKYLLVVIMSLLFVALSIRVKGMLVIFWLLIIVRYNLRPRYFIYNKNDMHMRTSESKTVPIDIQELPAIQNLLSSDVAISLDERIQLDQFIHNPEVSMRFQPSKKGGIDVLIAEVER